MKRLRAHAPAARTGEKRHADVSAPIKYREQVVNLNAAFSSCLHGHGEKGWRQVAVTEISSARSHPRWLTDNVQKPLVIGIVEIFFQRRLYRREIRANNVAFFHSYRALVSP